ncbi:MAG: NUDIX hydrolase [Rubrobacteraceae bacterium]
MKKSWKAVANDPESFSGLLREVVARPLEDWRGVYESFSPVDIETGERRGRVPPDDTLSTRRAAVLVPVLLAPEGPELVYTVRKGDLNDHAGQISFPGGSLESGDASLLECALREAKEEIDLSPDLVEIVGELEEMYIPPSNFRVSPYVGLLPTAAEFIIDPREVEEVFTAPLQDLLSSETFQKTIWRHEDREYEVPYFAVAGHKIWGATAAMTAAFLARLGWEPARHAPR